MKNDFEHGPQGSAGPDAFERALQAAMRHQPAPPELAARLLRLTAEPAAWQPAAKPARRQRFARLRSLLADSWTGANASWTGSALAAGVLLAVALGGGTALHVHQQHARAAEATRNFEQASQIEQQTLAHTRQQLREAGVELGQ